MCDTTALALVVYVIFPSLLNPPDRKFSLLLRNASTTAVVVICHCRDNGCYVIRFVRSGLSDPIVESCTFCIVLHRRSGKFFHSFVLSRAISAVILRVIVTF